MKGMPAYGKIEVGDRIKSVDGKTYDSADKMVSYISSKKAGTPVRFILERNGKDITEKVTLKPFKEEPNRVGIGVSLFTDRNVKVSPSIKVDIENIGGPSAGLMMSLEIYNQLTKEDETHGYAIAGTGTIDADGTVGPIGGIDQRSWRQIKPEKIYSLHRTIKVIQTQTTEMLSKQQKILKVI